MAKQKHKSPLVRYLPYAILFLIVLVIAVLVIKSVAAGPAPAGETTTQPTAAPTTTQPEVPSNVNPLTGLAASDAYTQGSRPYAFMVNNAAPARPQWGLCSADVVIECVVEDGITRMMWLFASLENNTKVGPIRSSRHDYVELAEGFDAIYIHWGGSPDAYTAMKTRNVAHIDGTVYSGRYFFRDASRAGVGVEHRGYTTFDTIGKAVSDLKLRTKAKDAYTTPFTFVKGAARKPQSGSAESVSFAYSRSFAYTFEYKSADGLYYQSLGGKPFTEDGGKQQALTNVLVLKCDYSTIDNGGRQDLKLTEGKGYYFTGGAYEEITWKKGIASDQLQLFAADGSALQLNPGRSYIGFVQTAQASTIKFS